MFFFDNEQRAREDFHRIGQEQNAQAIRAANSAANRGTSSPAALAMGASQAAASQRAALAPLQAQMLAQGRQQDQQAIEQLIGTGLQIGGSAVGMALGGPAGGQAGGAVGNGLGHLFSSGPAAPTQASMSGQPMVRQPAMQAVDQAIAAPMPQAPPPPPAQPVPFDRPGSSAVGGFTPEAMQTLQSLDPLYRPMVSDEGAKDDIRAASTAIDEMLRALNPSTFTYNQGPAQGQHRAGVMAQDLAQTDVGRTMVTRDQEGRMAVDPQAALSAMLAAQARLNERLDSIERRSSERGTNERLNSPSLPGQRQPQQSLPQAHQLAPGGQAQTSLGPIDYRQDRQGHVTRLTAPMGSQIQETANPGVYQLRQGPVLDQLARGITSLPVVGSPLRRLGASVRGIFE